MDLENLKARYYMLLGQAEEAKNIYARAVQEVNDQLKKKEEDERKSILETNKKVIEEKSKLVNTEEQPQPPTTPGSETPSN